MTLPTGQILDHKGNPIAPAPLLHTPKKNGYFRYISVFLTLIAALALFITNIDTILSALHLKPYKGPLISNQGITPQGAFPAVYGVTNVIGFGYNLFAFPSTKNPFFSDPRCFPVPVLSFSLTNPNNIDLAIDSIVIEAVSINTQKVSVGEGQMCGGAGFMIYECLISTNSSVFTAQYKQQGSDFLKLSPGELATVNAYIRSSSAGLYKIRSFCTYTVGSSTKKIMVHDFLDPIYFFDEMPKQF